MVAKMQMQIVIEGPASGKGNVCEPILRALPGWFGIETAIVQYRVDIDSLPTWLAKEAEQVIGFVSIKRHTPHAAEVYVMGLLPQARRKGIGTALLIEAQEWLADRGVEYLQVKTLGPSAADENFAATRAFYEAMDFRPLEEFKQLWGERNPCLMMIKRL